MAAAVFRLAPIGVGPRFPAGWVLIAKRISSRGRHMTEIFGARSMRLRPPTLGLLPGMY